MFCLSNLTASVKDYERMVHDRVPNEFPCGNAVLVIMGPRPIILVVLSAGMQRGGSGLLWEVPMTRRSWTVGLG